MKTNSIFQAYKKARQQLSSNPDVVAIGVGLKEVAHDLSSEQCIRVYVAQKKKEKEVSTQYLVPKKILGFPTDVHTVPQFTSSSSTSVHGGVAAESFENGISPPGGTIACPARIHGSNTNVILCNEHVFEHNRGFVAKTIFQPSRSTYLGIVCHEIGTTLEGRKENVSYTNGLGTNPYYIDAAIAELNEDVTPVNTIEEIGVIAGSQDISELPPEASALAVRKHGAVTDFTEGIIEEIRFSYMDPSQNQNIMIVRPTNGYEMVVETTVRPEDKAAILASFSEHPQVQIQEDGNDLEFTVDVFGTKGDSGSAVVDSQNRIIGLLYARQEIEFQGFVDGALTTVEVPTGKAMVCHIAPVLAEMNIDIFSGTFPSSGKALVMAGKAVNNENREYPSIKIAVARLESELKKHPKTKRIVAKFQALIPEIIQLVHHRRPVKFVWHKFKGPGFVAAFISGLTKEGRPYPNICQGVPLELLASKMWDALFDHGSAELQKSLLLSEEIIATVLENKSIDQVLLELDGELNTKV